MTNIGRLHVLTDFFFQQRYTHAELAEMACAAGADVIQFRQKHGAVRDWLCEARRTIDTCRRAGVPMIVNDSVAVTRALGADGVHLGQDDFPVDVARQILGPESLIGATATTVHQAVRAEAEGASYIGFGPVFPTRSKRNPAIVKGLTQLSTVCKSVSIPVIAIAGITSENVTAVLETGAHGAAIMTAISTSSDPFLATSRIRERIDRYVANHTMV